MANKSNTGRSKKSSSSKKAPNGPIPIDGGSSSSQSASSGSVDGPKSRTQAYPGIEEEIRRRAYELYQQRGCQQGFHHEDWTRAESEIMARISTKERSA